MTRKDPTSTIGRAAAAAALAVLLSACGKDVVVRSGGAGGAALPAEERLFLRSVPLPSVQQRLPAFARDRARRVPTAADREGPNAAFTDLMSPTLRAGLPATDLSTAARDHPSHAQVNSNYARSAPYTRLSPTPASFWRETAIDFGTEDLKRRVDYHAVSGLSQSSRGDDRVHAAVGWSGGEPTWRVELRHSEPPGSPGGDRGRLTHWALDSERSNQADGYFTSWTEPGGATRGGGFRSVHSGGGALNLFVLTDRRSAADTDWLATGIWWSYNADRAPYSSFGVFADGGDVYNRAAQLAGTATYTGAAHGLFSHWDTDNSTNNVPFRGSARLTADFADAANSGSVSGRIYGMTSGGQSFPGLPAITLRSAGLETDRVNLGVFAGHAGLTWAGRTYSGKWGGQFFGDPGAAAAGAAAHPRAAAGTFGVTAGAGERSAFIGTFQVRR